MLMLVHLLSFGLLNFGSLEFVLNGCLLLLGESKILFELGDQLLTATMFLSKVLKFLLGSGELVLGVGELLRLLLELTHYAHLCFLQVLLLEFFFGFLLPHNQKVDPIFMLLLQTSQFFLVFPLDLHPHGFSLALQQSAPLLCVCRPLPGFFELLLEGGFPLLSCNQLLGEFPHLFRGSQHYLMERLLLRPQPHYFFPHRLMLCPHPHDFLPGCALFKLPHCLPLALLPQLPLLLPLPHFSPQLLYDCCLLVHFLPLQLQDLPMLLLQFLDDCTEVVPQSGHLLILLANESLQVGLGVVGQPRSLEGGVVEDGLGWSGLEEGEELPLLLFEFEVVGFELLVAFDLLVEQCGEDFAGALVSGCSHSNVSIIDQMEACLQWICCCFDFPTTSRRPSSRKRKPLPSAREHRLKSQHGVADFQVVGDEERKSGARCYCCPICTYYYTRSLSCSDCGNCMCMACFDRLDQRHQTSRTTLRCPFCSSISSTFADYDLDPRSYFDTSGNGFLPVAQRHKIDAELAAAQASTAPLCPP